MAVITKFFVVRNGIELDQVFTDKKEAMAYDNMLDAADELEQLIRNSGLKLNIDDTSIREISIVLAKNGSEVTRILKNVKSPEQPPKKSQPRLPDESIEKPELEEAESKTDKPKRKK